jgi:ATP-dependent RNA helicase RhlE
MAEAPTFEQFKLNRQLLDAVKEAGFSVPTDIQQKAIPVILGGQEVIGIAQTGTGKTAAYLLPVLMKVKYAQGTDPRAVILVQQKNLPCKLESMQHNWQSTLISDFYRCMVGLVSNCRLKP